MFFPYFYYFFYVLSNCYNSPEEVNRVLTDRISTKLFCPTQAAVDNLKNEGIVEGVHFTGDPMYDAFLQYSRQLPVLSELEDIKGDFVEMPSRYYYLTCHREENSNETALHEVLKAMTLLDAPVIYPVHPRNLKRVDGLKSDNVILVKPVGYLASLALLHGCEKVITDSGGLQREAFWAKKQCVTLMDKPLWLETHVGNRNQLVSCKSEDILGKLSNVMVVDENYLPFGDGEAAVLIINFM